ncbi:hypothetical protein ACIPL1_15780 [Pseudomonas sp. NPDC090202]|uniref:hypothetical protein n=1 Tax=unclassified Pseudomonas TaxID=196821 RepID=UPI0038252884
MNSKKTVSVFFSITFLGVFALGAPVTLAAQGGLALRGQVVNAGCDARLPQGHTAATASRILPVNAGLSLEVMGRNDACHAAAVPVVTGYVERSSLSTGRHTGVVTVTYQ